MKPNKQIIVAIALFSLGSTTFATDAVTMLLNDYQNQSTQTFSTNAGRQLWTHSFMDKNGNNRSCADCHTADPRHAGKHTRTGKKIEPLAPSINKKSLSKTKNIQKWLKRNCKWTLGRECTAQEKGDVLTYLNSL